MKRWRVDIGRDVWQVATLYVEAESQEEAETIGRRKVRDYDFEDDGEQ